MTEAEWLTATEPIPMLGHLGRKANERKLRLFGICCCRQNEDLFRRDRRLLAAIELAEQYVEGTVAEAERETAVKRVHSAWDSLEYGEFEFNPIQPALLLAPTFSVNDAETCGGLPYASAESDEHGFPGQEEELASELSDILRDLFGNPFRPVTFSPAWLTSTVVALAEGIYADRAFDRLPILADALQDAGCEDADVLNHCRGDGPHVRGCWVVDGVLGKG